MLRGRIPLGIDHDVMSATDHGSQLHVESNAR